MPPLSCDVRCALRYIETHLFSDRLTVQHVLQHVGGDSVNFPARFRRETGSTVARYIETQRLLHARKLLSETDAAVSDVAFEVGYHSHEVFTRTFRRNVGMSPSQYRAHHRLRAAEAVNDQNRQAN